MTSFARRLVGAAALALAAVTAGTLTAPAAGAARPIRRRTPTRSTRRRPTSRPGTRRRSRGTPRRHVARPGQRGVADQVPLHQLVGRSHPRRHHGDQADQFAHGHARAVVQAIVNSLGLKCAPSAALFTGEIKDSSGCRSPSRRGAGRDPRPPRSRQRLRAAKLGGMITLDGVRALKRLPELRLSNSPVALAGTRAAVWPPHGGGAQPDVRPDVKLTGVAQGGVPRTSRRWPSGSASRTGTPGSDSASPPPWASNGVSGPPADRRPADTGGLGFARSSRTSAARSSSRRGSCTA